MQDSGRSIEKSTIKAAYPFIDTMAVERVRPSIRVLTPEQRELVHATALDILKRDGIRVDDDSARKLFGDAGCRPCGNRGMRIPSELIDWTIASAPCRFEMFDRQGNFAFALNGDGSRETVFGVGVTNLYYQNPKDDTVVPFGRRETAVSTQLGNALEEYDLVATPGAIRDLPVERADILGALEMAANTRKPLVLLIDGPEDLKVVFDLYEHLFGDLSKKPFIIPYFNPITPLVLNAETCGKMRETVLRGLPLIFSNYGMSGATTPATPAATLALLTAELLAGLTYSQLLKKGTPVVLGSLPAQFDMRHAGSVLSPQTILLNLACAEMMHFYRIPHVGTSGSGTGWAADILAAGTLWMNHLTSCLGKVGMAPFVGGNFDSLVFSPTLIVYADDIIRQARRFAKGFPLDGEAMGLEEISQVGPGGNYLTSAQTLRMCRDKSQRSGIWPVYTVEKWQAAGRPKAEKILREKTMAAIDGLEAPDDRDDLIAKGEAFVSGL